MFQSDTASVLDDAKAWSDTGEKYASFVVNEFADLIGQIHTFLSLYFVYISCLYRIFTGTQEIWD
jgi:hypothetical protein